MIQKTGKGRLILGVALGAAALNAPTLTGTAVADHQMMGDMAMSAPMMVSGKVNNYWTDESGYVTAVDVQTANGPAVVRLAPGMAMRTMQLYPVGSMADLWVKGSMEGGMQKWDMVGMGNKQPTSWQSAMAGRSWSSLTAMPYTDGDPTYMSVAGKLKKVIVDDKGQIMGLIIETAWLGKGAVHRTMSGRNVPTEVTWKSTDGGAPMWTLVRVPMEGMSAPNHDEGMRRKTPLLLNDDIEATGYVESALYGAASSYSHRFAATGVSVNGRGVGEMGYGVYKPNTKTLLNFDLKLPLINNGSSSDLPIVPMGYEVYNPQAGANMSMGNAMMSK